MYTLTAEPPRVATSAQVSSSSPVAAPCSCRLLSHQTLLWHHRLGHPSLPRLHGMHSRLLVSSLPRSLPPLPPLPTLPCLPCVEGRQRAAPHSSSFLRTTAPLQTLHMDVWGPARISGQGRERYFLLVVDDYTRYTTVFPLRSKGEVPDVLIPWIRVVRLQLHKQFREDLPVLRLHSDRGGDFSSDLLRDFCRGEGILQSFTLPDSPQQNGIAEHCCSGSVTLRAYDELNSHLNANPLSRILRLSLSYHLQVESVPPPLDIPLNLQPQVVVDIPQHLALEVVHQQLLCPLNLLEVLGSPPSPGPPPPFLSPPPVQSQSQLQPTSPLPGPSPYSGPTRGLKERREPESLPVSPESCSASPVRTVRAGRVPRPRPPPVPGTHSMTQLPSTAPQRVPLPSPPASSLPADPDPASDSLRAASPVVMRFLATAVTDPLFEFTTASALVTELVDFAAAYRLSMDAEMASSKSTGTYVDKIPPLGANMVSGMWIFRMKRPPGSPPAFKARYVARGFSQRQGVDFFQTFSPTPKMTTLRVLLHVAAQRDYELHSLDFSTAFLQGSPHEEIWLRRPPGFTGSFPAGTQWSLRRPVYGLRQAPREWHDTLRTTLDSLGFAPSTADPSLFQRTDATLPPFYVLVYVDDLVFATADTETLAHVKSELQKRHTCTDLALPSDESVEPSGPYPELVGCLMYLMTCTRPDLAYPLSLLARYVATGRHRKVHRDVAKRVLRYLCSTSGMGLVLGGRARVVLIGHADTSWVDDLATQRSSQGYTFSLGSGSVSWRSTRSSSVLSSSCEAEIYAGAMATQELCWLTYVLTDLGEAPRSPPVLYVNNKAMLALCQEHRLEHRTKHIALRYFLARDLQQRGQLHLAYVASQANTADVFTKALQPCDHQHFCTVLGLVPTVPHLLSS
ncbi:unnamed protein product [Closterium sp. NIES-54]